MQIQHRAEPRPRHNCYQLRNDLVVTLLAVKKLGEDLLSADLGQELGAGEGEHLPVGVLLQGGVQPLEVPAVLDGVDRGVILTRGFLLPVHEPLAGEDGQPVTKADPGVLMAYVDDVHLLGSGWPQQQQSCPTD